MHYIKQAELDALDKYSRVAMRFRRKYDEWSSESGRIDLCPWVLQYYWCIPRAVMTIDLVASRERMPESVLFETHSNPCELYHMSTNKWICITQQQYLVLETIGGERPFWLGIDLIY